MADPKEPIYWVSYPSRFKKAETVHNRACDFYGRTHGRAILTAEITKAMKDCNICKGVSLG